MTTGYKNSSGADLSTVFAAGSGGSATGYKNSSGADLNTLFAPLSAGSAASATGYKLSSGADLNTVFAAIGTTGLSFIKATSGVPTTSSVYGVVFGGSLFVACTSAGTIYTSTNGSTWTLATTITSGTGTVNLVGCAYVNSTYFVFGTNGPANLALYAYSTVGTSGWTTVTTGSPISNYCVGVAYFNSLFIFATCQPNGGGIAIYTAPTAGGTLTSQTPGTLTVATTSTTGQYCNQFANTGSVLCLLVVTDSGVSSLTSTNGTTWTSTSQSTHFSGYGSTYFINNIIWDGTHIISYGDGYFATSTNGTTWTTNTANSNLPSDVTDYYLYYANSQYFLVGDSGGSSSVKYITSSPTTGAWTTATVGTPVTNGILYGLAYGASLYVVTGTNTSTSYIGYS